MALIIDLSDILRATLDTASGNEGYIGIAPDGGNYHVVVPVDPQIARSVKAGRASLDATPFGGYAGWHYFRCSGYLRPDKCLEAEEVNGRRRNQTMINAEDLVRWASQRNIEIKIKI